MRRSPTSRRPIAPSIPGLLFLLVLGAIANPVQFAAAQQPALRQRPVPYDTRLWQRVDSGVFRSDAASTVVIPPASLRTATNVLRNGEARLEAPLVSITTGASTLDLDVSVDPRPGLSCNRFGCEGTVQVGVVERKSPYERIVLPSPMHVNLYGVDGAEPSNFDVGTTRTLVPVKVRSRTQDAVLTVHPVGLAAVDIPLPVRVLTLRMSAAAATMDAWGLEKTWLNIAPVQGLDPGDTVEIMLRASGLRVDPSVVQVSAVKGARAELRSRGIGQAVITAQGPSYVQGAEERIAVTPPWIFLLFALIGGLVGAFGREKLGDPSASRRGTVLRILAVGLVGAVFATATALGLAVTGLPLPAGSVSELLAFAEAGIIAFAINHVLAQYGGKSGGSSGPPTPVDHETHVHQPA